ncbi:MAG: 30S ribosomal protein S18 [Candidatus Doudnabacteria bacterium]|nr:30S ribosomal protein S18 [Candidatus Doudnabacteria bacterium]
MPINQTVHRRRPRVRGCYVCHEKLASVDYKDVNFLRQFLSTYGKVMQRRRSKLCSKHQRNVALAIKRARYMALLPYTLR